MTPTVDYLTDLTKALRFMPEQASTSASQVDGLFLALLLISGLMVLAVFGLVIVFAARYRAGSSAERSDRPSKRQGHAMEIAAAGVLTAVFLGVFFWAGYLYLHIYRDPGEGLTLNVIGKQWMWKVQHPDGSREINTLHVPRDQKIRLRITSQDVIHSFYVPAFRLKRDAVPDTYTTAWFEATTPGEYHLFCAEYCGTDHSRMRGKVVVMSQPEYEAWLNRRGSGGSLAAAGKQLFQARGCAGCHIGDSTERAPSLAGIYGKPVALATGKTTIADEAYIRDSILLPQKHVAAGYEPIMPSFKNQISESDLLKIIAYIQSLEPGERGP